MVIALLAAAIGIPLAALAVKVIAAVGGATLPRASGLHFDPAVAGFATLAMLIAGVIVGLLPAMTMGDARPAFAMNEGGRAGMQSRRTRRLLATVVVAEIALAIALVAGAGRMMMSARNLLAVDPEFATSGRLILDATLPPPYRAPGKSLAWSNDVSDRLRGLGAVNVGMATSLPLRRERDSTTFTDILGRPFPPQNRPNARLRVVDTGFFDAMGVRVLAGREFTSSDRNSRAPVAIVNQAWVDKFIPGLDPLRERLTGLIFERGPDNRPIDRSVEIIGVAANAKYSGLDRSAEPVLYFLDTQRPPMRISFVITSTNGHPEQLIPTIRDALRQIDPSVPVEFATMSEVVSASLVWSRLGLLLMGTFGGVSLLLAGTGVFGVLAFVGAQRHSEMAVRLSLGATRAGVFRLMVTQGLRFVAIGAAAGTLIAWWLGRFMSSYVYGVSAADAGVLIGSAAVVAIVAAIAALAPAHRAATVDPSRALRP
jgi:predicted permease